MATTTNIHVTATDNELHIIASTFNSSSEIVLIKSGNNNPVNYSVVPQSVLEKGKYTLIIVGINWGGPQAFVVTLTTGGVNTTHTAPPSNAVGANWTITVPIEV
jgi:hypothetical protein